MKKIITFLLLATLCVGLCACSKMSDVESELSDDYKLETLSSYDINSLAEPLELDVGDYSLYKTVKATHKDHGYGVVILECTSEESAKLLENDLFKSPVVEALEILYSSSYSFLVNRYDSFVMVGERRAVVDVFSACKAIEAPGFLFWFIVIICIACVCGYISQKITSAKGYYGGFAQGFFLGPIGIIMANNQPAAPTSTKTPIAETKDPQPTSNVNNTQMPGWHCTCGRTNAQYVRTCSCGLSKIQALHPTIANKTQMDAKDKEEPPKPAVDSMKTEKKQPDTAPKKEVDTSIDTKKEIDKISVLKEYKALLDSGVITEEEFNDKKRQLLEK